MAKDTRFPTPLAAAFGPGMLRLTVRSRLSVGCAVSHPNRPGMFLQPRLFSSHPDEAKVQAMKVLSGSSNRLFERKALVYQHAPSSTQDAGEAAKWTIKWGNEERWTNPLMGWTSSRDSQALVTLKFPSKAAAIEFCTRNGYPFTVDETDHTKTLKPKSYDSNFAHVRTPPKEDEPAYEF